MEKIERRSGRERRGRVDRRKFDSPGYKGSQRRSGLERRSGVERRKPK